MTGRDGTTPGRTTKTSPKTWTSWSVPSRTRRRKTTTGRCCTRRFGAAGTRHSNPKWDPNRRARTLCTRTSRESRNGSRRSRTGRSNRRSPRRRWKPRSVGGAAGRCGGDDGGGSWWSVSRVRDGRGRLAGCGCDPSPGSSRVRGLVRGRGLGLGHDHGLVGRRSSDDLMSGCGRGCCRG